MLTRRIIPCLDVKGGRVVKGVRFEELRDAGDPVEQARAYGRAGAGHKSGRAGASQGLKVGGGRFGTRRPVSVVLSCRPP